MLANTICMYLNKPLTLKDLKNLKKHFDDRINLETGQNKLSYYIIVPGNLLNEISNWIKENCNYALECK